MTEDFRKEFAIHHKLKRKFTNYSKDILEFLAQTRPIVDGMPYSLIPYQFWIPIYRDQAHKIMAMISRQGFKTTWFCNVMVHNALAFPGHVSVYVTYDEISLSSYSNNKYRRQTIMHNPIYRSECEGSLKGMPGQRGELFWKNGSASYMVTDEGGYSHVEGKSANEMLCDEFQYQESENLPIAAQAMAKTQGKMKIACIGGEAGSPQQEEWNQTSQQEWHYDDESDYVDTAGRVYPGQGWRKALQFGKWTDQFGVTRYGLIFGNYMAKTLRGKWEAAKPENYMYPGYHISQDMFCHVPLSISDAINLYRIPPHFSIEWMQKNYPSQIFIAHVMAGFYAAKRRPLTKQDVLACMEPYRHYSFLTPQEVIELKRAFPERVQTFLGVDWGSSTTGNSSTIYSILLKWRGLYNGKYYADLDRYYLAHIERLDEEVAATMEEAKIVRDAFLDYDCDYGVGDLGYGQKQVNAIIDGGSVPGGIQFPGLTLGKFIGCWTRTKVTQVEKDMPTKVDDEGNVEVSYLNVDKSSIIDNFIDFIKWKVSNPLNSDHTPRPKLIIPYAEEHKVDFLIKDFTSIIRKDLEVELRASLDDPRQKAQKQYNHPPDSVMSIIYALIAEQQYKNRGGASFGGVSSRGHSGGPRSGNRSSSAEHRSSFGGTSRNRSRTRLR